MLFLELLKCLIKCQSYERSAQVSIYPLHLHISSSWDKGRKANSVDSFPGLKSRISSLGKSLSSRLPHEKRKKTKKKQMRRLSFSLQAFTLIVSLLLLPCPIFSARNPRHYGQRNRLGLVPERVTRIHFYFHDTVSGRNPTVVQIARATSTAKSPTGFGFLVMMDDPLTEGPEPTSKMIGRAQGIYGSADQAELGLLMTLTYSFTDGEFNGSTLSVLGRNPVFHRVREMAVVGGTGVFRFARGYALARTHWFSPAGDAVVEYNVTVVH